MGLPACSLFSCARHQSPCAFLPQALSESAWAHRSRQATLLHEQNTKSRMNHCNSRGSLNLFWSNEIQQSQSFPQQPVLYLNQSSRRAISQVIPYWWWGVTASVTKVTGNPRGWAFLTSNPCLLDAGTVRAVSQPFRWQLQSIPDLLCRGRRFLAQDYKLDTTTSPLSYNSSNKCETNSA